MEKLCTLLGDKYDDNLNARQSHSHGEDGKSGKIADAVVKADCLDDVVKTVNYCRDNKIKLTPFGAGTSLEGHVVPVEAGISLDLSAMNQIINISEHNMTARVEAGVTRQQLNHFLRDTGLFFSVDPGSQATIGGMASTSASGTNAVRYGTIKQNVMAMQVVMANGAVIETGTAARKSSAGYDLTHLFIGAEGTLGVITELLVKLHPIPEHIVVISAQFNKINDAAQLVSELMQTGMMMARIELLDALQMEASIAYSGLAGFDKKDTLFLEVSGGLRSVTEQSEFIAQLIADNHGFNHKIADNEQERKILWQARHNAFYAARAFASRKSGASADTIQAMITDSCVPPDRLVDTLLEVHDELAKSGLQGPIVGHMGDGNFHVQLMIPNDDLMIIRAKKLVGTISDIAIRNGGTCTGEHGIGMGKIAYLQKQHPDLIPWMRLIKQSFDPDNILNPNKIFTL